MLTPVHYTIKTTGCFFFVVTDPVYSLIYVHLTSKGKINFAVGQCAEWEEGKGSTLVEEYKHGSHHVSHLTCQTFSVGKQKRSLRSIPCPTNPRCVVTS